MNEQSSELQRSGDTTISGGGGAATAAATAHGEAVMRAVATDESWRYAPGTPRLKRDLGYGLFLITR